MRQIGLARLATNLVLQIVLKDFAINMMESVINALKAGTV